VSRDLLDDSKFEPRLGPALCAARAVETFDVGPCQPDRAAIKLFTDVAAMETLHFLPLVFHLRQAERRETLGSHSHPKRIVTQSHAVYCKLGASFRYLSAYLCKFWGQNSCF